MEERNATEQKMDKDEYREMKQGERRELYTMLDRETEKLRTPEGLRSYLEFQAKFLEYSTSNAILIMGQKPDAEWLRSFDEWKADGFSINSGEKGIRILEPTCFRDWSGAVRWSSNVGKVFDVTQTSAAGRIREVRKDPKEALKGLIRESRVKIEPVKEIEGGLDAYYSMNDDVLYVFDDLSPEATFGAVARETAVMDMTKKSERPRDQVLPLAECSAWILATKYGIEIPAPDVEAVTKGFEGREAKDIRHELSAAVRSVSGMNRNICYYHMAEKEKAAADREPAR
jgi:hypothetical protein